MERIRDVAQSELGWDDARWGTEVQRYADLWRQSYSTPEAAPDVVEAVIPALQTLEPGPVSRNTRPLQIALLGVGLVTSLILIWQLIRRSWLDREDVSSESSGFGADLALPEAYEKAVQVADDTADRLRREADRVHLFAALHAEKKALTSLLTDIAQKESLLADNEKALMAEWQEAWQPSNITPLSPSEMLGWLGNFKNLRLHADEIKKRNRDLATKQKQRQVLRPVEDPLGVPLHGEQ